MSTIAGQLEEAKRALAKSRKAFVRRFGTMENRGSTKAVPINKFVARHVLWIAWQAGVSWEKRQKDSEK